MHCNRGFHGVNPETTLVVFSGLFRTWARRLCPGEASGWSLRGQAGAAGGLGRFLRGSWARRLGLAF